MDEIDKIKLIWKSEKASELPNSESAKSLIKKYKTTKKRNVILLAVLALACFLVFVLTIFFQNPSLWTTILGEIFIFFGLMITLLLKIRPLKDVNKNEQKTNRAFLEDLKSSVQKKSQTKWTQITGMLMLSVGFGFYIYEAVENSPLKLVITYFGILLYAICMYFIFRPFSKKRAKHKIISLLEEIDSPK